MRVGRYQLGRACWPEQVLEKLKKEKARIQVQELEKGCAGP